MKEAGTETEEIDGIGEGMLLYQWGIKELYHL